eukprot:CAMPEP_0204374194 /NCGR_PEP_ID=MMETSP0469-20131031/48497_1 /ASSEMBLY_ACC=CAM_ASM_000384 /TAXON_ID=2969 /ORGANISM="Oxyrrhis marina" /LENGTH=752 /DNA_ID=CAMNT_0051364747 /DNA_START=31 /DNA_END=2289 /DNA_ORIENTATION=+
MLTNVSVIVDAMRAQNAALSATVELVQRLGASDASVEQQARSIKANLEDTASAFQTILDGSTGDTSGLMEDVKRYASSLIEAKSQQLQDSVKAVTESQGAQLADRFKKLETRVLADGEEEPGSVGKFRPSGKAGDGQLMKKVASRLSDFEAQMTEQMQKLSSDLDKKASAMATLTRTPGAPGAAPEEVSSDINALKYDIGELKDMLTSAKSDTAHVKRIVLACERDMEDFTAAMDAVNVDLDEMRARVDSTHSIITSRQRVEATVTAEISTMRLDMGDMQEALKAHDAWMEDVSASLQEAHERCNQLGSDIVELREQTNAKLDGKVDVVSWTDSNDDIDGAVKTVRDMVSSLRLEVDARRRKVDEMMSTLDTKHSSLTEDLKRDVHTLHKEQQDEHSTLKRFTNDLHEMHVSLHKQHCETVDNLSRTNETLSEAKQDLETQLNTNVSNIKKDMSQKSKESADRSENADRHNANVAKEASKRMNTLELRISGVQGACGEHKRDITKMREEVNGLTVKSAAHDVDINKVQSDASKLEKWRAEDTNKHKQDMDAVYEELDKKLYETNFITLEELVSKLARGVVKLAQVVGVFPGARMDDGTDEELDIDVELLNWEDCCINMVTRVDKMWRQQSSQKHRSVLDLVNKKADHSVLRLLQISQQHIEGQLERVRHERELWKEVVDKRNQQPLQLALTLKDQQQMGMAPGMMDPRAQMAHPPAPRAMPAVADGDRPLKPPSPPGVRRQKPVQNQGMPVR